MIIDVILDMWEEKRGEFTTLDLYHIAEYCDEWPEMLSALRDHDEGEVKRLLVYNYLYDEYPENIAAYVRGLFLWGALCGYDESKMAAALAEERRQQAEAYKEWQKRKKEAKA